MYMKDIDAMLDELMDMLPNAAEEIEELRSKAHSEEPGMPAEEEGMMEEEAPAMPGFKPIPPDMQDEEETEEEDEEAMY
jgi:hypothetical protein